MRVKVYEVSFQESLKLVLFKRGFVREVYVAVCGHAYKFNRTGQNKLGGTIN
jgi:hypothetical protein